MNASNEKQAKHWLTQAARGETNAKLLLQKMHDHAGDIDWKSKMAQGWCGGLLPGIYGVDP